MRNSGFNHQLQLVSARFSFFWMVAANLVGMWMAALLIWPRAGEWTGRFGYGRWMPLHMDWHLYGWCSLPLLGLLFRWFLTGNERSPRHALAGFFMWSFALFLGGFLCLFGLTSGKLFLMWSGPSRILFPAVQAFIWSLLAGHVVKRWKDEGWSTGVNLRLVVLLVLSSSPIALFIASGQSVYPPVDPASGGATGHSLLASTLGIIGVFGLMPHLAGATGYHRATIAGRLYLGAFLASVLAWMLLDHGNESNTQPGQILGLAVLLPWIPLIGFYFLSFEWGKSLHVWVLSFLGWWLLLTLTGFATFLSPVLTILKFTNGMVAHAHLAMGGMITSFNMVVLAVLGDRDRQGAWTDPGGWWMWQSGCLVYVLAMLIQGFREGLDPSVLYSENTLTNLAYSARFLAGAAMLAASLRWLVLSFKYESR
ncbi:MAG: hypothetical protein ACO3ZW_07400 [Opitutales bacterium]|jgi:cytochrome c oxidase cbb3-type subunit 1